MKTAVFIGLFIIACASQELVNIFCYNPPSGGEVDAELALRVADEARDMIEMEWQDTSVKEAVSSMPEVVNQTFVTIFQNLLSENYNGTVGPIAGATVQGLLNTTKGIEVMTSSFDDPNIFAEVITYIVSDFDRSCMPERNVVLWDIVSSLISTTFPFASLEQLIAISTKSNIQIATMLGEVQLWRDTINSLTLDFNLNPNVLSTLFGSEDAGEIVKQLMSAVLDDASENTIGIAEGVGQILTEIQTAYNLDIAQIIEVLIAVTEELN
eukprot:TRINITY_DN1611_c0_g1_i1.p1 TRINITY_DN1611_c0_g1~~TRINITY_DN1611_c0_g1_i1.p1  ORF type:complete len:294 (-),score=35.89 TRINITY_DN1611_c0_g1_i1:774-1577(-)